MTTLQQFQRLIIIAGIFLSSGHIISAQTSDQNAALIDVTFTVYALKQPEGLHYLNPDQQSGTALQFYSSSRSPAYTYRGRNPIIFYKDSPAPTADDPAAVHREKVASIELPTAGDEYLFIFFPNPAEERESYRIYPLPDSTAAFPYGSFRLFNATPHKLFCEIEGQKLELSPGASPACPVSGGSASLRFGFLLEDEFRMSYDGLIESEPNIRDLMMVFPPHIEGSVKLQRRFIRQYAPVNNGRF